MKCLSCGAKTQLPLCNPCTDNTRQKLNELPWWLDRLTETAIGQAALGTPARHTRREPKHLNGDDSPIEPFPNAIEDNDENITTSDVDAQRARHRAARRHALAAGGINPPAAELLDDITDMLKTWALDIAETHHTPTPQPPTPTRIARWLANHTHLIATHPAADEFADELTQRLREIKRIINRPTEPKFIGPCPGTLNAGHDHDCHKKHPHNCGTALTAHRTALEVTCTICGTTHNVEHVTSHLAARADDMRLTSEEIIAMMQKLGTPIPERTWQKWRKEGRIKIRGYKRPDNPDGTRGAIRLTRKTTDDQPVYRVAEVRKLHATTIRHTDALTRKKENIC